MLPPPFNSFTYILASQSLRRQQLMLGMGFEYQIIIREIEETVPEVLDGAAIAVYLCEAKAAAFEPDELLHRQILITADTIVWHQGKMLGKPAGPDEAVAMLTTLSGSWHEVYTGVSLKSRHQKHSFCDRSEVLFKPLTREQIEFYVENYKPFDKAGAYGVQEWIGYVGVEKIIGSFYNVMGLPTQLLIPELEKFLERESSFLQKKQ